MTEVITVDERTRLVELETVVEQNAGAFVKVRDALFEIRDKRLYRDTHETFAAYLETRFKKSISTVYRQLAMVEVQRLVEEECPEDADIVKNERQARVLAKLSPEHRKETIKLAKETAPDPDRVTAEHLDKTAKIVTAKAKAVPEDAPNPDLFLSTAKENFVNELGTLEQTLRNARRMAAGAVCETSGLELFSGRKGSVVRALDELVSAVSASKPKALCEKCCGKKCEKCGLRGWEAK